MTVKTFNNKMIFRKTKFVFNILILLFSAITIHYCYAMMDNLLDAQPFVHKKYFINENDKLILENVHMSDDSPIVVYDMFDKWHSTYSVYQNGKLMFNDKYPSVDEQKVIDLVLEAQNKKINIFLCSFLLCVIIRIFLSYKIKHWESNEEKPLIK